MFVPVATDMSVLSAREEEVAYLAGHMSNARIAERLGISKRTVDHHVSNALRKTGARDRHHLSQIVTESGIASEPRADLLTARG